jgi:hypothetical protein
MIATRRADISAIGAELARALPRERKERRACGPVTALAINCDYASCPAITAIFARNTKNMVFAGHAEHGSAAFPPHQPCVM